ncbi:unnamed protein product [Staurois parvus]|uniref:Uncharacterized protein n=1 Tax=Staurois parvus TaxID=386267 RepID=A0ABN9EA84_9NEOB|nr:unnamed protein product [Staurois parvus]
MNSQMYCSILKEKMLPSLCALGRRALSQHDCTPVHKARSIKTWMSEFRVEELDWPAES